MADTSYSSTHPPPQPRSNSPPHPQTSTNTSSTPYDSNFRRRSLPSVFPLLFPKITSSTFLVPSTAEGRPIPLDDSTAAHRTAALRQLSRSQPSSQQRHSRTTPPTSVKRSGAGTYSQPVVVRTYPGASSSSTLKGPVSVSSVSPSANLSSQQIRRNTTMKDKSRRKGTEKRRSVDAKLPPLESFTFKSIIADIQQDVGADLERIAEICAHTKYSLSNQYEVHIAPQGSGSGFLGPQSPSSLRHHAAIGPTLQTVSSDNEHTSSMQRKRRGTARRRNTAYGTLETIMSSSRSSDEDRSNKKPAAEIIEEVSRTTTGTNDESTSANSTEAQASSEQQDDQQGSLSSKPVLFATAIIDKSRSQAQGSAASQVAPGVVLLSGPAEPQTSQNHLETKTSPVGSNRRYCTREPLTRVPQAVASKSIAAANITTPEEPRSQLGLVSSFSSWVPWKGAKPLSEVSSADRGICRGRSSYAEGMLRELLRSTEQIGDVIRKDIHLIT